MSYRDTDIEVATESAPVSIGRDEEGAITLWACEDFGDTPSRLTPEQAVAVGEALINAAKEASRL